MAKLKHYTICLDGIDKTGKNLIQAYVYYLSKKKYLINCRGIMTMIAYAKLYGRSYEYDLSGQEHILNVLLTVYKDDWQIRCKKTNEADINFEQNSEVFEYAYKVLSDNNLPVMKINTSCYTPYTIALMIIKELEKLEYEDI